MISFQEVQKELSKELQQINPLYGEALWIAIIEDKNDLHYRTYNHRELDRTVSRLVDWLSDSDAEIIFDKHNLDEGWPQDLETLQDIYSSIFELRIFSEKEIELVWDRFFVPQSKPSQYAEWARKPQLMSVDCTVSKPIEKHLPASAVNQRIHGEMDAVLTLRALYCL